jgi:hypothetical protein
MPTINQLLEHLPSSEEQQTLQVANEASKILAQCFSKSTQDAIKALQSSFTKSIQDSVKAFQSSLAQQMQINQNYLPPGCVVLPPPPQKTRIVYVYIPVYEPPSLN